MTKVRLDCVSTKRKSKEINLAASYSTGGRYYERLRHAAKGVTTGGKGEKMISESHERKVEVEKRCAHRRVDKWLRKNTTGINKKINQSRLLANVGQSKKMKR